MSNVDKIQPVDEIQPVDAIQIADEISPAEKKMNEWVVQIKARLENPGITHSINCNHEKWPSIFGKWQCWDDFGVSFLPETKKWQFVGFMERRCGLNVRSYLEHIQEMEDRIWSYYEGVHERFRTQNWNFFIEYLLGNSCFLIFAMVTMSSRYDLKENLGASIIDAVDERSIEFKYLYQFIDQDRMSTKQYMLTMEYQIPWFVVEAVYTEHSQLSEILNTPLDILALLGFVEICPKIHESKKPNNCHEINVDLLPNCGFKHLLHIFHWSRSPKGKFLKPNECILNMDSFYIPSATKLKLSEIVFEKHASGSIDVDYTVRRFSGLMQLAPWQTFPYSFKIFESLLRFERGYEECGLPFTAYVACMVCLLQTEEDIRLLRVNGIVPNTRNDEKHVLRYVQQFKTLLHDDVPRSDDLEILSENVMARYKRRATRFYGEFKSQYCSNKWITISVMGGILLFVLTFIQTVLSFIQTKYSVLSFNKQ